ncbi:phosphoadenosine phosphosulfate reductase [Chryseobacterium bernardetii]|uniref:phosphoadenosine phosphosulfate reductase n=1 Tax=Chryseobacterium bernardetii TaxID=1241978 RepID=UPI003AF6B26B
MKKNNSKFLLVNVSGGRSSAMMARHIQTSEIYNDYEKLFVFCNTGLERPETIQFLKDQIKYWDLPLYLIEGVYSLKKGVGVKSKQVDFDTLNMDGKPFSQAIEHLNKNEWCGVPNEAIPYCSEYLKKRVSEHFAKNVFGSTKFISAIGFRREDMPKRVTWKEVRMSKKKIFPLLTDFGNAVDQFELNRFFNEEKFKLQIHSRIGNCVYCQKKSDRNLIEAIQFDLRKQDFKYIDWYRNQEKIYGNRFFRGNLSIDDLVKTAQCALNDGTQLEMFSDIGEACMCNSY